MTALDRIQDRLGQVKRLGLYRQLRHHDGSEGGVIKLGDRQLIDFSSNDYLGLTTVPELQQAAMEAIAFWGSGSGASRLITGSLALHQALETDIAQWKNTDSALIFNSGYQANIGVLGGLTKTGDRLFYDQLSHASIRDGINLSRAQAHEFRHNDIEHLEQLLSEHPGKGLRLIVTESVFSMDGDLAPLPDLMELAETHDCLLVVDEAHGVGVFGRFGAGLCDRHSLESERLIQLGTCGKALGSFGAYVAGQSQIIDLLKNRARSFIYTTSLPPAVLATTRQAIAYLRQHPERQQHLHRNRLYFSNALKALNYITDLPSQICPIILGSTNTAIAASKALEKAGFWVQAIRPPTVPNGTARLRISLNAAHTPDQLAHLCQTLTPWLEQARNA